MVCFTAFLFISSLVLLVPSCGKKDDTSSTISHSTSTLITSNSQQISPKQLHSNSHDATTTATVARFSFADFSCPIIRRAQKVTLPVPVGFTLRDNLSSDDELFACPGTKLHYHGKLNPKAVTAFYLHEMDRLGWEIVDLSSRSEMMLVCKKETSIRVISATQSKRGVELYIIYPNQK